MTNPLKSITVFCIASILAVSGFGCSKPEIPLDAPAQTLPPESAASQPSKVIYLVGEQEFTPISFEKDGKVTGINVDIIREVFKRMGMDVKLELMPWERCKQMALDGSADGFFSPYKTPERDKNYLFVGEPLMVEKNVLTVLKDSNITYDGDMRKLSQYTFGMLIGYATLELYISDGTITKIDKSHTVAEALKKLTAGRGMDIYVNTDMIVRYSANQEGLSDKIRILDMPLSENPSYLAFTRAKDMRGIAEKFEAELKNLKSDGTYKKIVDSYMGQ